MNPTVPTPLENGSTIKRFRLLECAGEDLDGFLYRAEDPQTQRQVSIKEFFPPGLARRSGERVEPVPGAESDYSRMLARFIVVTNQLACIDHPALMRVDDYWLQDGTVYVQMPWYAGRSLQDVLGARQTPVESATLAQWLGACAEALKVVHRSRDLHGGLSPDRIMVLESGQVVLSPLSTEQPMSMLAPQAAAGSQALAALAASAGLMRPSAPVTATQRSLPPWVALEQTELAAGEWTCGPWTDVYALAAIAHLAITGQEPPNVFQRVEGAPVLTLRPAADLGHRTDFLEAVERGLSLYPAGRPHSISAFMVALGLKEAPAATTVRAVVVPEPEQPAPVLPTPEASEWVEVDLDAVVEPAPAPEMPVTAVAASMAEVEVEPAAEKPASAAAPPVEPAAPVLTLVPPSGKGGAAADAARDRPGVLVWGSAAAAIVAMGVFGPKVFGTWTGQTNSAQAAPVAASSAVARAATGPATPASASTAAPAVASAPMQAQVKPAASSAAPAVTPTAKVRSETRKAEAHPQQIARAAAPAAPPPPAPAARAARPEPVKDSATTARSADPRPVTLAHQDHKAAAVRVSDACADALIRRTLDPSAAADTSARNNCR